MKSPIVRSALCLAIAGATASTAHALDTQALLHDLSREPGLQLVALHRQTPVKGGAPVLLYVDERALDARSGEDLLAQVRGGRPALVLLSKDTPARGKGLLAVTGVRPHTGSVVLTAGASGEIETSVVQMDESVLASAAIAALAENAARPRSARRAAAVARAASTTDVSSTLAPQLRRVVNQIGLNGQLDAVMSVTVVRNVSRTEDTKTLVVRTRTSIRPADAGITNGTVTGANLWASRLPVLYTLGHALTASGGTRPVLETYLPEADGRTDFSYSRTDSRMFSIAGSIGTEFGGGATPEQALQWTAQSPFSLNASYEIGTSETLSHTFQDYSLRVVSQSPGVRWELPLAGRLGQHALVRPTARLPVFKPEALTPMMRNATMDALSVWHVPGRYNGTVTFRQEGGFTLHEDRWSYRRANLVRAESNPRSSGELQVDIDLGGWELARETPVLLQSAEGVGKCMVAVGANAVGLAGCDARNDRMMWGFDQARRYRNLKTGRCLAFNPNTRRVEQQDCALANNQFWEWRADRLHSVFNLLWRLYVTADDRIELVPDGSFVLQDQPVNQFNSLDIPWSSYPSRPSRGDTMPSRNSTSPRISDDWVNLYNADVTASQLWQTHVVSRALRD